jgi:hypothetical protein
LEIIREEVGDNSLKASELMEQSENKETMQLVRYCPIASLYFWSAGYDIIGYFFQANH